MIDAEFFIEGEQRPGKWLVTCDHATNRVPVEIAGGDLGLCAADMARHIAYDPGALGTAQALARALDAPMVAANFSRLVIDPNRGIDDPTLLMRLYDGTIIPANRSADREEITRRLDQCYHPYDAQLKRLSARPGTAVVSVHSFTPQLAARPPRPWHVGVLYADDNRLAEPLLAILRAAPDIVTGDNEPYAGHLPGDAIDRHALRHGRPNVLLELRNDLIATPETQAAWAARIAPMLIAARRAAGI